MIYNLNGFQILNAAMSLFLMICIVALLLRYIEIYNMIERIGHGVAGAAVFLSMFKQLGFLELVSPFADLYQLLWRVGWVMLLGGKIWRLERHRRNNERAVRMMTAEIAARRAGR